MSGQYFMKQGYFVKRGSYIQGETCIVIKVVQGNA